ncbi:WXG100 family type VII secretion target [Saccharothrix sp. ALI-22-I]|uniref:WXG100 family type VII secretion target n=1 Tax=Saccharothrix sp. ALI-22-I TaxID=1933778 RepID=UPI00097CAB76|nr:WXG100 family type VII secretion target [Saccharothrix sp. ALI-22-I]ONI83927.1 WXG100 family type VII secretion target [Saccharothrix sp. ALI-22-I]
MAGYSTGHPELVNGAKDIVSTNESVQAVLGQLGNTIDGLSSVWAGGAAVAFNKLMERFREDADKLQKALMDIATQMDDTAATYLQQEEEQAAEMSNITNRLGS